MLKVQLDLHLMSCQLKTTYYAIDIFELLLSSFFSPSKNMKMVVTFVLPTELRLC